MPESAIRPAGEFDRDIASEPVLGPDGGERAEEAERRYAAELRPGWVVGGGLNGGYLLAAMGHAVRRSSAHPDPLVVSAHFLATSTPGPATIATRTLREGRSVSTYAVDLEQDGQRRITALATCGDLADLPGDVETTASAPDLPPPEECWSTA